jgi:hypothetical protein
MVTMHIGFVSGNYDSIGFPKFRGESEFSTWAYRVAEYGDYFVPKNQTIHKYS